MTAITSHSITANLDTLALTPEQAEVTLDESWSPFIQARLVCPIEDTAMLAAVDPRTPRRGSVRIQQSFGRVDRIRDLSRRYAGRTLAAVPTAAPSDLSDVSASTYSHWTAPGTPYVTPYARYLNLGLRSREIDHEAGTVTLTLASDEALLQDNAHVSIIPLYVPAVNVYEAVQYVLARIGTALFQSDPAAAAPFDNSRNVWEPGVSAWDWLAPIVQAADLRLWCDEQRQWHLTTAPTIPGAPIALSASGTIKRAVDSINRDDEFYRAVLVTYEWADAAGVQQKAYDLAFVPPWLPSTQQRVKQVTYRRPYAGPGAAARILRSVLPRGRKIAVTAVSDYAVEPGRAVTVALPSTPLQTGRAAAVTWHFPADDMEVRMRELVDSGPIETEYTPLPEEDE